MKTPALQFRAGSRAAARIRKHGLRADDVRVFAGASGGPKWFILSPLDQVVFPWLSDRSSAAGALFLIGTSAGAWRMAAFARRDPVAAIRRFEEGYLAYRWHPRDSPRKVSDDSRRVLDRVLAGDAAAEILGHPFKRLGVLVDRSRGLAASDGRLRLALALIMAVGVNRLGRRGLGLFFERLLFSDPRDPPPFADIAGFRLRQLALTADNLGAALMGSGSIPWSMAAERDIPGAPPGYYRDGGVLDYHLDIPFLGNRNGDGDGDSAKGIVLYPHFYPSITPGWFDKNIRRRQATAGHFDDVLLLCPSPAFVAGLPYGKIPDRRDFGTMADRQRLTYWRTAIAEAARLADDFTDCLEKQDIADRLMPLDLGRR